MNKVAVFGKKGSIAKYDLTNNKPIWVGDLPSGYIPHIIGQYEDYVIVFSWAWFATKMVHCFRESSGELLWSHYQHGLHSEMTPFIPHTHDKHMYYLASQREVSKLSWETGKVVFRKMFKKSIFKSYSLVIISDEVCLISKKDALMVNQENGMIKPYPELAEKLNLKELTASLGNGVFFMSSIYSTHPQYHDGGAYGGDAGGSGGN